MLPTFVIGLREGLEAALIVGIVAAFLSARGRRDAVRWVWAGVALAVALCAGFAAVLQVVSAELPQRQQEALETVIGLVAVVGVPHPYTGEAVKAYVVPKPGSHLATSDVTAFVGTRLARFKWPTIVELVDALPHSATGKVAKGRLRERSSG